ncbi:integral membrane protein S linking to the trans Golgi network-domain-containing protein [Dichotomocladium elegans]|nr:integral membrane protein S linking to the trans Golgi network-domain-containing protein [Dichotomocladium elegans]
MAPSSFRATGWDPLLIIAQLSLDSILDDTEIRADTVFGWTLALVWLANAVITIPVIVILIQRARLVLDFVLTLFGIHIMCVWCHTGHFPTCLPWWILQTLSMVCMILGGEWACMQREMEPILVSQKSKTQQTAPSDPSTSSPASQQPTNSISSKAKRKTSDAPTDDAPFTRVMGKAKQVLMQSAQRANLGKNRMYEVIPMKEVADGQRT